MPDVSSRTSVRKKLLLVMVTALLLVGTATFVTVLWITESETAERQRDLESQIRKNLNDKGSLLAKSHAIALGPLVYDNAFGDVKHLVEETVSSDSDIVYGLFLSADGKPWAYVSPTHPARRDEARVDEKGWLELGVEGRGIGRRDVELFGHSIIEHSAPVQVDNEALGTIRYGMSDERLQALLAKSRKESREQQGRVVRTLALLGLAIFTLGMALMLRAAARLTAPLLELTQGARRIALGERKHRVQVASGDEVEELAHAFNEMLDENEKQFLTLEEKTAQALEASRLKSEFLANMSHEIRTPMNGVLGMVRLLQRESLNQKSRKFAETIEASAHGLMTIINDILDFSKMEAGKYSLQYAAFDPRMVVAETCELLSTRAAEQGVELVTRVAPTFPARLKGDPDRFRQVLNNIVGNAVKFTERGEIFVDLDFTSTEDDRIRAVLTVVDSGIGIPKEALETLFDAFSQVDGTMVRKHGGTGLGLSISHRLVELMGGSIDVESTVGVGSKFTMDFLFDIEEKAAEPPASDWTQGKCIGVLEPSSRWSRIVIEHLTSWGLDSERWSNYESGFSALKEASLGGKTFDALILGVALQSDAATRFVKQIRTLPGYEKLPIIALTQLGAGATLSEVENELRAQVSKPLRVSELFNALQASFVGPVSLPHGPETSRDQELTELPILVVDDNQINRIVAVEELEHRGFLTDTACDGAEALEKVKAKRHLLVLMDCQMPVMDGYTSTAEIRKFEAELGRHTPIIALTAHAMAGERERVLLAGMDDYLSKPFRAESLLKLIRQHGIDRGDARDVDESGDDESRVQIKVVLEHAISPERRLSATVMRMALEQVPGQILQLSDSLSGNADNAEDARVKAHQLKGTCLAVGADEMAAEAATLERELKAADFSHAGRHLERIRTLFEAVSAELERRLSVSERSQNAVP